MAEYRIAAKLDLTGAQASAAELRKVSEGFKKLSADGKRALADLEGRDKISRVFAELGKSSAAAAVHVKASAAVMSNSLDNVAGVAGLVKGSLAGLAGALTLGAAVSGVRNLINGLDALNDAADATGASINKLAGLEVIAKNNASNLDQVTAAIVKLNQALNAAPDSGQARALQAIGLDAAKLRQLDPADALLEVSRAFAKFADDGNKARLMQELLGKSSRELAPIIKDLARTTGSYSVDAEKAAAEAERFNKQLGSLAASATGVGRSFLLPVLEGLNNFIDSVRRAVAVVEPLNAQIDRLTANQTSRAPLPLVPPAARALADNLRNAGPQVSVSPVVRNLLGERRLGPNAAAAAGVNAAAAAASGLSPRLPNPAAGGLPSAPDTRQIEAAAEASKKLEAARTKTADATKRQAEAEAKLRQSIAATIADERAVLELLLQGVPIDQAREQVQLRRQGLTATEIEQLTDLKEQLAELQAEQRAVIEAAKEEAKAREELEANIVRQRQSAADAAADLEAQVREQLFQNETFGKTGVALALLTERRNLDRAAEIERFAEIVKGTDPALADEYLRQAAALRERAEARIAGAVQQEDAERAAEVIRKQQDEANKLGKVFDQVGQSLSNSLQQAFTQGGSFLKNFIRNIKAAFLNLVVRFAVQPVLSSVAGSIAGALGFSSAAQAGQGAASSFGGGFLTDLGGGFFDALNYGKNAFDLITGNFTSGLSSLASKLGSAGFTSGASFVNGFASALNGGSAASFSGASSAFNLGNFAGQAAPFLPAVFSLLQGDIKGAAFSGGGAAIGTALGGPIGGIIGSTIGSLLGGLFGGSGPKAISTGVTTTREGTVLGAPGKAGRIDGVQGPLGQINEQFIKTLDGLLNAVGVSNTPGFSVSSRIGLFDKRRRGGFNFQIEAGGAQIASGGSDKFGNDVQKLAEALQTELLGPALRDAFVVLAGNVVSPAIKAFLNAVTKPEEVQARLQSVASLIQQQELLEAKFNANADQIIAAAQLRNDDLNGPLAALNALLTPQEVLDEQTKSLTKAFADLGFALPGSVEQLREYVKGIDKSTAAGQELFNETLSLVQPFLALSQAMEQVNGSLEAQRQAQLEAAAAFSRNREEALAKVAVIQQGGAIQVPQFGAVPGFAAGGDFGGGLRLVGENGPELEVTGPSRIFNAQQTSQMLSGDSGTKEEVAALRADLRASQTAIASLQSRMVRLLERWDGVGLPPTDPRAA